MPVKKIPYTASLREGTDLINEAIDQSNKSEKDAAAALAKSLTVEQISLLAKAVAENTQQQLDSVVKRETDSDAMSRQAAFNAAGEDKKNLKVRLDEDYNKVTQQLADIGTEVAGNVQSIAMPENISTIKTKSPKLVIVGAANDKINVVQYNGNNYVLYELDAAPGTVTQSVGGAWELIRLKKALLANDVYVAKTTYDAASVVGAINTLYAPAFRNVLEDYSVFKHADEVQASFLSSSGDGFGIGCYGLVGTNAPSEVSWKVKIGTNRKCNMLVFGTTTGSTSADILVNGEVVHSFDPTKMALGTNLTYKVIEFEIPTRVNLSAEVVVTLRNNDITNKKLYFSCVNYLKLKNYDGRDIDFYKVFTTSLAWINHGGASDYAIFDHDLQQWCGSYHGGETRTSARMMFSSLTTWSPTVQWDTGRIAMRNKADVPVGWYITPSFKLQQLTNINGKGKMLSLLDWDTDGTLQMNFSFFDGSIIAETFYTALTTTHVSFDYLRYPRYEPLPSPPANVYFKNSEGYIIQYYSAKGLSLGQRFTKFGSRYIPDQLKHDGWLRNDPAFYKKPYYGFADGYTGGVLIESLQFRKALDFMTE